MGIFKSVNKGLDIADQLIEDKDARREAAFELMKNEAADGDVFSKRARPTVIYVGLFIIVLEMFGLRYWILESIGSSENVVKMSTSAYEYFLFTWGGIVAVYSGGKSYEKFKIKQAKK